MLFGEALGRFLPNTGLLPETAWQADAEFSWTRDGLSVTINPFFARIDNLIGQRMVTVDTRKLRQRYNLSGTMRTGLEVQVTGRIARNLDIEADVLWLRARADAGDAAFRTPLQRPDHEIRAAIWYRPTEAISVRAEYRRVGPAVDLGSAGDLVRLPPGDHVNLRARLAVATAPDGARLWLVGAIDNVFDTTILPQLGLPLPGRMFRIGIQLD